YVAQMKSTSVLIASILLGAAGCAPEKASLGASPPSASAEERYLTALRRLDVDRAPEDAAAAFRKLADDAATPAGVRARALVGLARAGHSVRRPRGDRSSRRELRLSRAARRGARDGRRVAMDRRCAMVARGDRRRTHRVGTAPCVGRPGRSAVRRAPFRVRLSVG